jgi:predicted 2-oxoglutarate/Fe(II)-dependent dioxygenase YbiX
LEYTAQDKGHYDWHTDDNANFAPRTLTMLIGLNDDYRGGELKVLNDRNPIKLRRNQAVIFPSNFLFSHKVERVTEGKRRVLVVWIK